MSEMLDQLYECIAELYQFSVHLGRLQRAPKRVRMVVCE